MSQQKISKEEVAEAIAALRRDSKPLSLPAIRAAAGNKGSLNTIQEIKKQIEAEERAVKEPPHALEAFRTVWAEAVRLGRAERDTEIGDLQEVIKSLSTEAKVFEGATIAASSAAAQATAKYELAMIKLNGTNEALAKSGQEAEVHGTKLLAMVEQHQLEMSKVRDLLAAERARAHDLELKMARLETMFELATVRTRGRRTAPIESKGT